MDVGGPFEFEFDNMRGERRLRVEGRRLGGRKIITPIGKGKGSRGANTGARQRVDTENVKNKPKEAAAQSDSSGYLPS